MSKCLLFVSKGCFAIETVILSCWGQPRVVMLILLDRMLKDDLTGNENDADDACYMCYMLHADHECNFKVERCMLHKIMGFRHS